MPRGKGTYGSKRGRPPKRVARLKKDAKERRAGNPYGKPESARAPHARARVGKKVKMIVPKKGLSSVTRNLSSKLTPLLGSLETDLDLLQRIEDAVKRKREKAKKKKK
tara:strand:+ start:684 stop:1007 length:324 start_codon:yes stop_codon:yes gene_type:complete